MPTDSQPLTPRRSGLFFAPSWQAQAIGSKAGAGMADTLTMGKELSTIDPTKSGDPGLDRRPTTTHILASPTNKKDIIPIRVVNF
jgi:hypothetical protein